MTNITLAQCFGENVAQDATTITIQKSDLPGLTPTTENTSEELVVGILLKILENFEGRITTETGDTITDGIGNPITYNQGDWVNEFQLFNWRSIFSKTSNINYRIYQFVFHKFEEYGE